MKLKIVVITACSVILGILTACSNNESAKEKQTEEQTVKQSESEQVTSKNGVVSYHGKYLELAENMDELEKDAPIIIKVLKKSEKITITKETKENTFPTDFYTMSDVEIKNIEKDETGKLKENMMIKVLEYSVENAQIDGKKYDLTIDGYKNMEEGKEYTLFLEKNTSGDNYVLANAVLSKFPVEKLAKEELFLDDGKNLEETEGMEATYQDIYEDVMEEYSE
ncbi:hypothetical protein ACP0AK_02370 [Listeria ivanovii]|uniref:Putative oligopeptide ABC transporter AppA (Binding protein) n=1 Tax=Listeria ivanovii (strain ATCC BAA-678 / PAM 55) TaxID=881621 RepID=G2ZFI6_LISIP|nr:hypothetical protein [Listeria ivanovii]AHI55764.1 hypothetical protein AX25_06570 [Listeria ivanovii WSLC3009]AIS65208.1 hypothetical protein JL52_06445 [Listeria ivanovii subsp. ivanovii]MBC1760132.1 hypothetical protein [Listeria ivanovii]MBK3914638.1 hypothetical protein [Listeria ivanovii subsp. ivanovii]MBK3921464.1 hypothetical protein [Listeria ivanovii subsp. ivanovii]